MSNHGSAGYYRRDGGHRRRGQDDALYGHRRGGLSRPFAAAGRGGHHGHGNDGHGNGVDGYSSSSSSDDGGGGGGGGGGGAFEQEEYYSGAHRGHHDDGQQPGVTAPGGGGGGGEWVEGPGYRMKAPTEAKRQQVIRGQQANERAERELQARARSRGKLYKVPPTAQSTTAATADGRAGAAAPRAAPKDDRELRAVRMCSVRARRYEQQQKAREYDERRKQEEDAPIQKKLQKARRASEALEARQQKEYERVKQTVRSAWQQRQTDERQRQLQLQQQQRKLEDEAEDAAEDEQIQTAIRNSIADLTGDPAAFPSASSLRAPAAGAGQAGDLTAAAAAAAGSGGLPRESSDTDGFPIRGEGVYWDPVLDGPIPDDSAVGISALPPASNGTHNGFRNGHICNGSIERSNQRPLGGGGGGGDGEVEGAGGGDWDAVMAEVITVLEWDVVEEVGSEANRHELCRTLRTLLKNVLRGDAGRRRVRDNNPTFYRTVGRWACGRRLMRLAGFAMEQSAPTTEYPEAATAAAAPPSATAAAAAAAAAAAGADANGSRGGRADYVWVSREPTSAAHLNILEYLVEALEGEQVMTREIPTTAAVAGAGAGGGGGRETRGGWTGSGPSPQEDHANMTRALEMLAVGSRSIPSAEESEFTRLRKQQDEEFQDALRTDMETSAAAAAAATKVKGALTTSSSSATAATTTTTTAAATAAATAMRSHPLPQDSSGAPSGAPALGSEPLGDDADPGGRTVGGGIFPLGGGGDAQVSSPGGGAQDPSPDQEAETAQEKRAKIAASYARLGLGA